LDEINADALAVQETINPEAANGTGDEDADGCPRGLVTTTFRKELNRQDLSERFSARRNNGLHSISTTYSWTSGRRLAQTPLSA